MPCQGDDAHEEPRIEFAGCSQLMNRAGASIHPIRVDPSIDERQVHIVPEAGAPPNGGTVNVGDRFVLDLAINSGVYTDTTAQQAYITFTNSVLQNARVDQIATSCVLTNSVTADNTVYDATLQNEVAYFVEIFNLHRANKCIRSVARRRQGCRPF